MCLEVGVLWVAFQRKWLQWLKKEEKKKKGNE